MNAAVDDVTKASVLRNEPMRRHTSWRVGGPADVFFEPATVEELEAFLANLPRETPVHFLGLGSNLLVRDGGIRGVVVATGRLVRRLERFDDTGVHASAGLPCALLARQCVRWQLGPAAFFAGIPGSVGGALAMNAGAFGGETWSHVERVETIDRHGVRRLRPRTDFEVGYRTVRLRPERSDVGAAFQPRSSEASGEPEQPPDEWFLGADFRFEHDTVTDEATLKRLLAQRAASQPLRVPSCGSVFRNPPGDYAGRLIEQAGLKGFRLGGAMVSEKHGNFILNTGTATADDIERLIEHVRAEVARQFGVELELEVRILGEPAGGTKR
ncbi:MAG TPA: UDP-N-acetylmuramate dehydrogenase [Gammaproteobacteria bacterium]